MKRGCRRRGSESTCSAQRFPKSLSPLVLAFTSTTSHGSTLCHLMRLLVFLGLKSCARSQSDNERPHLSAAPSCSQVLQVVWPHHKHTLQTCPLGLPAHVTASRGASLRVSVGVYLLQAFGLQLFSKSAMSPLLIAPPFQIAPSSLRSDPPSLHSTPMENSFTSPNKKPA